MIQKQATMTPKGDDKVPIASAYEVLSTKEDFDPRVELDKPLGSGVSPEWEHIPEARGLIWRDDFFDDDENVVAVFDFDYDSMESHYKAASWGCFAGTVLCFPGTLFWCLAGLVPCYINKNVKWNVRAQHLAVTRSAILFVHDKRPALWGEECAVSRRTKAIPFDQVTDCTVTDAGSATCTIGTPLSKVTVDKPGFLTIVGLEDPHAFRKLILAMKKNSATRQSSTAAVLPVTMAERIDRGLAGDAGSEEVAGVLREIRDELRQHNKLLQTLKSSTEQ